MKYCGNCGAKLGKNVKFCGDCGSPVEEERKEQSLIAVEPPAQEDTKNELAVVPVNNGKTKKTIKRIFLLVLILAVVAGIGVLCWKLEVFHFEEQPTNREKELSVDQNNLYETLDWQEDQDETYELKKSLIEGNSDGTVQEIFEESAYFTPQEYMYAVTDGAQYYLVTCDYEEEDNEAVYQLVFKVNHDEHLELAELYKDEKKVKAKDFDTFYEDLYITLDDVEWEEEEENFAAYLNQCTYLSEDESTLFIDSADEDNIVAVLYGGTESEMTIEMYYVEYNPDENSYIFGYEGDADDYITLSIYPDDPEVVTLYLNDGEGFRYTQDYYLDY